MLDKLINLVKQNAGEAIINNPAIPNSRNDEAVGVAGNSIIESLKNAVGGGGLQNVLEMFGKGRATADNPVVQQASGSLTADLQNKLGLDPGQAASVAGSLVPNVLNQLAQRTADPADNGFQAQDIFNQLSGGKTAGFNVDGLLSKFKDGMDQDRDGDVDLQDLKGLFSGGGSVVDKVKGLFN